MKKYTEQEIMNALVENQSMEAEYGEVFYYIHIAEDGSLLPSLTGADNSEIVKYKGKCLEDYDHEVESNPDFMEVVEKMTEQVNNYIEFLEGFEA